MVHGSYTFKLAVFCCLSFTLLSLNFYTNFLKSADHHDFLSFTRYSERSIIGRLIKSRQEGIFSSGALSIFAVTEETVSNKVVNFYPDRLDNKELYLKNKRADFFSPPYFSQICGQGILYSMLDRVIPAPQSVKLRIFHAISSALTALVLTIILAWFYVEFGSIAGSAALVSALISSWLTVFARDLWWSTWAFYVPAAMVMLYFLFFKKQAGSHFQRLGIVIFLAVLFKTVFNGYEYITTTLVMMMVPFVYYCFLNRIKISSFLRGLGKAALGTGLALVVSLGILSFQISSVSGNFAEGFNHLIHSFQKRSHADPDQFYWAYADSLKSGTLPVVLSYLKGEYFGAPAASRVDATASSFRFSLSYAQLIVIFALMSACLYLSIRIGPPGGGNSRKILALIVATWFSILAPLSWFVIFKAHSYIHQHLNFIVWQMPFTFFGAAVTGLACRNLFCKVWPFSSCGAAR